MSEQQAQGPEQPAGIQIGQPPEAPHKPRLLDRLFQPWIPQEEPDQLDWVVDADRARIEQNPIRAQAILYCLVVIVLLLVIWSAFAEIDEVTRGEGKVIPSRQVQIIQSLDGGVVTELLVKEGDTVEPGQLLVRLDDTRFTASFRENQSEFMALSAKAGRLSALAEGKSFEPDAKLLQVIPEVVEREMRLYRFSLDELEAEQNIALQQLRQREQELVEIMARRDQLQEGLRLASRELRLTRPLVRSGAVSEVELLRLERDVNQLKGDLAQAEAQIGRVEAAVEEARNKEDDVKLTFLNNIREQLTDTMTRINSLKESSLGLSDRVAQTEVRSPVRGTVKSLYYNTIGGVVLPGKEIVEVVPLNDTLVLEARIQPKDIAFLRPGQKALVKFTAYDFVVFGGLDAVVEQIGADTVMDDKGNPYYLVRVRTLESSLGEDKPIIPGMVAEVDILTGKKTILAYLMKPVLRAKQYALSER